MSGPLTSDECIPCLPELADAQFMRSRIWEDEHWRLSAILQGRSLGSLISNPAATSLTSPIWTASRPQPSARTLQGHQNTARGGQRGQNLRIHLRGSHFTPALQSRALIAWAMRCEADPDYWNQVPMYSTSLLIKQWPKQPDWPWLPGGESASHHGHFVMVRGEEGSRRTKMIGLSVKGIPSDDNGRGVLGVLCRYRLHHRPGQPR